MNQRRILLIGPNAGDRRNLAFLLHLAGYKVTEMAAIDEALNRLNLSQEAQRPDLLLVCEDESGLGLPDVLARLQQQTNSVLVVTRPQNGIPRGRMPQFLPSCQRTEVIETLARFWATESVRPPFASNPGPPQE